MVLSVYRNLMGQMGIKCYSLFITIFITYSITHASSYAGEYSDDAVKSAYYILTIFKQKSEVAKRCKKANPHIGYKYEFIDYIMNLENRYYLDMAVSIIKEYKKSGLNNRSLFESVEKDYKVESIDSASQCNTYFTKLMGGRSINYSKHLERLKNTMLIDDHVRVRIRNNDMVVGCLKGQYNSNVKDVKKAHKTCDCLIGTVSEQLTNEQIDEYLELAVNNTLKAYYYLFNMASVEDMAQCIQ